MNRDYIKIPKPDPLPTDTTVLSTMDDKFWQKHIFSHILLFYKNHDKSELKNKIVQEQSKKHSRVEKLIAKYIRKYLRADKHFDRILDVNGESESDTDVEGFYDIKISNTYWSNKNYLPFECKNLTESQTLINEYVYVHNNAKTDGGVYRYFNGKYAQAQSFGGMLGFVLDGDVLTIKEKIKKKLEDKFDISPEGDLTPPIQDSSIEGNNFTFTSLHGRKSQQFSIYHILMDLK